MSRLLETTPWVRARLSSDAEGFIVALANKLNVRMKLIARTPKGPFHAVIYNPRTGVEIDSWHGSSPSEAALRAFQAHHESTGEALTT